MAETPEEKATREAAEAQAQQDADKGGKQETDAEKSAREAEEAKNSDDPYAALRDKDLSAVEVNKLIDKIKATNGEAAGYRHKLREQEIANETETQRKIREAAEEAEKKTAEKYQPVFIKAAAVSALSAAGADKGHDSLIKLLDRDKLEVQDDGTVKGIDAEVKRIKAEFPKLFEKDDETPKRRTPAGSRADGGAGNDGAPRKKSTGDILADRVLGRN